MATFGYHNQQLSSRCRVCGRKRDAGRTHKSVEVIAFEVMCAFGVDVRSDTLDRHPTKLCSGCWKYIQRSTSAEPSDRLPETALVPVPDWPDCKADSCALCEEWRSERRRGRAKKNNTGKRGRPAGSGQSLIKSQDKDCEGTTSASGSVTFELSVPDDPTLAARLEPFLFQLPLFPDRFLDSLQDDFLCPMCMQVLNRPMAVPVPGCEHASCLDCWKKWLPISASCPVCRSKVAAAELQPLPRTLWQQLCTLRVHCDFWQNGCSAVVELGQLRHHAEGCHHKSEDRVPELPAMARSELELSVADVLQAPVTKAVSSTENRLLAGLLQRLSHQHQAEVGLPVHTGGRPVHISFTPVASSAGTLAGFAKPLKILKYP